MMSCEICGGKVTLKVGFDGLAASLMAYCRAIFSLRNYIMMVLRPPRRVFLQATFEKLLDITKTDPYFLYPTTPQVFRYRLGYSGVFSGGNIVP